MNAPSAPVPEVAVIVPVHNDAATLPNCLHAILRDSAPGWELVVVDDSSTDGSGEAARRLGARVVRLPKNSGVSAARNTGAKSTTASILIFVDADIVPEPGALSALVEALRSHPEWLAVGAYPRPEDLGPDWSAHFVGLRSAWGYHWREGEEERLFSSIQSECGAMRRAVFLQLDGFSEKYGGVGMEEFKMAHDLERLGHGHYLIRSAAYRHYYKPLRNRCLVLLDRTARWVPLFFRRKRFESRGGFGTGDAALSCLLTFLALIGLAGAAFRPALASVSLGAWVLQALLERPFLLFAKKNYGPKMMLYSIPALQALQFSIGLGFIWGLVRLPFSPEARGDLKHG